MLRIPSCFRVQRNFQDDETIAFLLIQALQSGDVQAGIEADDGLAKRILLAGGEVGLVGGDYCHRT